MKKTVGKSSIELIPKQIDDTHSAHEQMLEQLAEYDNELFKCLNDHKNLYTNNFYLVVLTKRERLLPNVFRNYFFARQSCPTPEYDQTVYIYNKSADAIDFLWTVPSKDTCRQLKDNLLIPNEERQLRSFVLDFFDGTLLKIAKKLNNELPDSPLLIKENE